MTAGAASPPEAEPRFAAGRTLAVLAGLPARERVPAASAGAPPDVTLAGRCSYPWSSLSRTRMPRSSSSWR